MKSIIHVHQHKIKSNLKNGTEDPPIIVRNYKEVKYGNYVEIVDADGNVLATIKYDKKPLSCGARCWIETDLKVNVIH